MAYIERHRNFHISQLLLQVFFVGVMLVLFRTVMEIYRFWRDSGYFFGTLLFAAVATEGQGDDPRVHRDDGLHGGFSFACGRRDRQKATGGLLMAERPEHGRRFPCVFAAILWIAAGSACAAESQPEVRFGDKTFTVRIADTNETRRQGLSGSAPLAEGTGMLFIFERDERHAIWMKDMRFALDIVWISRFGSVVHIERNVDPNTYPKSFAPGKVAKYVLEISSGAGEGVSVGDPAHFENVPIH